MCMRCVHFNSYHVHHCRHTCRPYSFYPYPIRLVNPSHNIPGDYPGAYKAGWNIPGGEVDLPCHSKAYHREPISLRGIAKAISAAFKGEA